MEYKYLLYLNYIHTIPIKLGNIAFMYNSYSNQQQPEMYI